MWSQPTSCAVTQFSFLWFALLGTFSSPPLFNFIYFKYPIRLPTSHQSISFKVRSPTVLGHCPLSTLALDELTLRFLCPSLYLSLRLSFYSSLNLFLISSEAPFLFLRASWHFRRHIWLARSNPSLCAVTKTQNSVDWCDSGSPSCSVATDDHNAAGARCLVDICVRSVVSWRDFIFISFLLHWFSSVSVY